MLFNKVHVGLVYTFLMHAWSFFDEIEMKKKYKNIDGTSKTKAKKNI